MNIKHKELIVKQHVEALEIFTGFETRNRYLIKDMTNKEQFYAYEESNLIVRQVLKTHRPLSIHIITKNKQKQLSINRPFFFIKPTYTIKDSKGTVLGTVKKRRWWSVFSFIISRKNNEELFSVKATITAPWTFNVYKGEDEIACIKKKWSGIGRELFTDSDTFHIDFGEVSDQQEKQLILGAAFAIDLTKFERK